MDRSLTLVLSLLGLALAVSVTACGLGAPGSVGPVAGTNGLATGVEGRTAEGQTSFARRVDGHVQTVFRARLTSDREQTIVVTGRSGGADQGSILVLDDTGEVLVRHRVRGDVPPLAGGVGGRHLLLGPDVSGVGPHVHDGRRLVTLTTGGITSEYGLALLEAVNERTLEPRYQFWNDGVIRPAVVGDGLIVSRVLANSFRDPDGPAVAYPIAIVVISIDEALEASASGRVTEGVAPGPADAGRGFLRYYVLPETSQPGRRVEHAVSVQGRTVRVDSSVGFTYFLDTSSRSVRVEADEALSERTARGEGPLASHPGDLASALTEFADRVRVFVDETSR